MNEELTRVFEKYELEAMIEFYKNNDCSRRVAIELATALLEERAKPKLWDDAPKEAVEAFVTWYEKGGVAGVNGRYNREPPKTRARQIAEEISSSLVSASRYSVDIDIIEATLNKYADELEGKE